MAAVFFDKDFIATETQRAQRQLGVYVGATLVANSSS